MQGRLHAETRGEGELVVLVHGFTQSGAAWDPIAGALAKSNTVVALDAPGHGASSDVEAGLTEGADLMARSAPSPATWVGYSMGGRFALHVALRHPAAVSRLVLVSATAGMDDAGEREARRESDEALAERIESEGVEAFVRDWLAQPLFATLPAEAAAVESRLGSTPAGLASSLRLAGTGCQRPLWSELNTLDMPVLIVAGELDVKYTSLARRLVDGIGPNARLHLIAGAGHACHLEKPDEFLAALTPFLEE